MENCLWIRIKKKRKVLGDDGVWRSRRLVPFHFNTVQVILAQGLGRAWYEGRPYKCLTPKARQLGSSTFWQGLLFGMAMLEPGYHIATVAHTEAGVSDVFGKTQTFQKYMPFPRDMQVNKEGRITWTNDSSHWTGTVKTDDALGKGPTPSAMHLSECANFSDRGIDADGAIASALNGIGDSPDAIVCYESTAKGNDPFFYKECERAKDPKVLTENKLMFLPWFLDPEYSMTWKEYCRRLKDKDVPAKFELNDGERALREELANVKVDKQNCWYRYKWKLTDEQLIWRRFKTDDSCFGKAALFSRYYPATYEEAFSSTVQSLFSADTMARYLELSAPCSLRGNIEETISEVAMVHDPQGWFQQWHAPIPGREYVIGADVGGFREPSDPNALYVLDSHSLLVMGAVHGYYEFDDYAYKACSLGRYYNYALLAVENNHNPAVAKTCFSEGYQNLYHYNDEHSFSRGIEGRPGFNTNTRTKPELVAAIQAACRDGTLKSRCRGFAREMPFFVLVKTSSGQETYKATGTNKDDRVMAMAIALHLCKGEEAVADTEVAPVDPVWVRYLQRKRFLEAREERRRMAGQDAPEGIMVL